MKTCARCGRTYPPDQTVCTQCGLSLPGPRGLPSAAVAGQADPRVAQIDFLLAEMDEWVRSGWVAPEQARRLWDVYQDRRIRLAPAAAAPSVLPSAPPAGPFPLPPPVITLPPAAPLPGRKIALAAFLEARNLSLWQLLGAALLLAGLVGLIGWTWGSVGKYLVLALMLGLTGGLPALARSRFVREEAQTKSALAAVAALLIPLDIVAINAFRLLGGALGTDGIGLAASLVCLPLYAWVARREPGRWPVCLLSASAGAALYFALHVWLPHSLSSEMHGLAYGLSFTALTLGFFLAAWRAGDTRREVWRGAAQIASLSALALALWLGGLGTLGPAAAPLLLLGIVYAVAAALLNDRSSVFLSEAALTLGGILALSRFDNSRGDYWVWYAAWGQAVGLGSHAVSRRLRSDRAALKAACADGGLALALLALIGQGVRLIYDVVQSPTLFVPPAEVGGLLAAATLSFGYFVWTRRGIAAASLAAYLTVLVYWLGARHANLPVNFAVPLAISALTLWRLKRPQVSLGAAITGLLLCVYTAALGFPAFWFSTTALALPLLMLVFALRERDGEEASVWPLIGAAVLEVLLLESRLPWAKSPGGWEPNYGFGLVPISLLALVVSQRRSRVWLWAGLTVTAGNVLLQLGYAASGPPVYSPMVLLALGAFLAAGVAFLRPGSRASACAVGMLAAFYAAFWLGSVGPASSSALYAGREALASVVLLAFAPLAAFLAYWERRPAFLSLAALAGALGIAHGLHRIWNPDSAVYAAAIWPEAALLFAAAVYAKRQGRGATWQETLAVSATAVSLCALLTAALTTLLRSPALSTSALLAVVCAYGALYAASAFALQSSSTAGLSGLALSGAFWLAIVQNSPSASAPKHGFALSFGGLVWLALAAAAEKFKPSRFAALSLNSTAIGLGMAAILVTLVGLNGADAHFAIYTLLVAGSVFLGASRTLPSPGWGQAGVLAYFCAYFAFLAARLGAPGMPNSDFYLVPAGLYVLVLGLTARRRDGPNTPAYFLAGLLMTLTPTFAAAWAVSAAPLHGIILLTECVGAVFYGIAARLKIFVGAGTAFLLALFLRETQGFAGHIHWAVYATALGLLILASALYFEKRGEAVRRWAKETREKLGDWD